MPTILHAVEIQRLLDNVTALPRLLIFLDVTTGLRQSELFGTRWSDLEFDNDEINVVRSVVHGVISRCKTESSAKPIPMNPLLAGMLKEWRKVAPFPSLGDWVFASKRAKGKRPIWGQTIMRKQIHPAIEKLDINKRIGFLFDSAPESWNRYQSTARSVAAFIGAAHSRYLYPSRHSCEARGAKRRCETSPVPRIHRRRCAYGK